MNEEKENRHFGQYGICPDCGRYAFLEHICPRLHTVERKGFLPVTICAISQEEAAELALQERNEGAGIYAVEVTDPGNRVTKWNVLVRSIVACVAIEIT